MLDIELIGKTIKYPIELDTLGNTIVIKDLANIKQSVVDLLSTPVGRRMFDESRGSRIYTLMYEPNDDVLEVMLDYFIQESIEEFEPRIEYLDTVVRFSNSDSGRVYYTAIYQVLKTKKVEEVEIEFNRNI